MTMDFLQIWSVGDTVTGKIAFIIAIFIVLPIILAAVAWKGNNRLSSFPGPRLAAWTRLYSVAVVLTGREHEILLDAHEKYGPVMRWQPNTLLISNPTMLPRIYHLRSNKTPHYNHSPSDVKGMVEENDWQKHRVKRHRLDPAFSHKSILGNEALVDGFAIQWIDAMRARFANSGQIFDFSDWGNYLVLDTVTKYFFDQEMGFIEHGDNTGLLSSVRDNNPAVHALARLPRLKMFLLRSLGGLLMPTAGDGSALGNVLQLRDDLYKERLTKGNIDSQVGLDRILFNNINKDAFNHEEFKEDVLFVILGASDTTGHSIRCVVRNLLQHPPCLARLREEIDTAVAKNGGTGTIPFSHINTQMPYLSACLRESLRHDPPVVSFLPRWVDNPGGVELCGRFVPAGVEVACSPYVISRSRDVFGDDVHSFRPERYIDCSPEWAARAARYDFTFGYGPRHCIGQKLSHLITCKAIVQFFYHFDVDLVEPGAGKAFLTWNYSGLKLKLRARRQTHSTGYSVESTRL